MRLAPALLLLLAAPALAQDPIPDTTAAWRYFPLEVGNVWEYQCLGCTSYQYRRHRVTGDTLVGGSTYFRYHIEKFNQTGSLFEEETLLLRFDTLSASIEGVDEGFGFGCRLDAAFGEIVKCPSWGGPLEVYGGQRTLTIGTDTIESTLKGYTCCFGDVDQSYVADIGYFGHTGFPPQEIVYARVGGVEYGEPIVLAAEPDAPGADFALSLHPNPTRGVATLALTVPVPQTVTVEVFDVLGRRVYREAHAAAGATSLLLDGRAWKPGAYVVRVTTEDGLQATARLVRR